MKKILLAKQMQKCDLETIEKVCPSSVLMERAAKAVFDVIVSKCKLEKTLVVCGSGNNGGDGILVAILLHNAGYNCHIWYVGDGHRMSPETEKRYNEAKDIGVCYVSHPDIEEYTTIVDAVLGTGFSFTPSGEIKAAIDEINNAKGCIVSVDIPSGIWADNGNAPGSFVRADITVAIQEYKRGHCLSQGIDASGQIYVCDIGINTDCVDGESLAYALEDKDLSLIPRRRRDSHKGTYGRVLVVGGKMGMSGAAYLSASAAYRSGAGIVEIFTCEENRTVLQTLLPEAIVTSYTDEDDMSKKIASAIERATAIVIGPGMGTDKLAFKIVNEVFSNTQSSLIVDADALNISAKYDIQYPTDVPVIVTPHPGELSRLTELSICEISDSPWETAADYANLHDIICVAKNARTVITDGENIFVNMAGGPSLAKGGSGDVLTGIIAGMLCQGLSPIGAASMGVYVHSRAGELSAEKMGDYSPMARDIVSNISRVLKNAGGKL